MRSRLTLPLILVATLAAAAAALALFDRSTRPVGETVMPSPPVNDPDGDGPQPIVSRTFLTDLVWTFAATGWVVVGANPSVRKDATFRDQPISLGGRPYPRGLGVYPYSEIEYALDGRATEFRAVVGIEDRTAASEGSVQFHVFVDGAPLYSSPLVYGGDAPRRVRVPVAGASTLRLVVTNGGDSTPHDFAVWASPRLVTRSRAEWEAARREREAAVAALRQRQQDGERTSRAEQAAVTGRALRAITATAQRAGTADGHAWGGFHLEQQTLVLANRSLGITLGFGGPESGVLSVVRLPGGEPVASGVAPALVLRDAPDPVVSLRGAAPAPDGWRIERATDAALGEGVALTARFVVANGHAAILQVGLRDDAPAMTLRLLSPTLRAEALRLFDAATGARLLLEPDTRYLSDANQLRQGQLADDALVHPDVFGPGKPLVLWSPTAQRGLVLAFLDPLNLPARWEAQRAPGQGLTAFTLEQPLDPREDGSAPRLYLEAAAGHDPSTLALGYRAVVQRLYPTLPLPEWVRHQWLSWYAFNTDATEDDYRRQIDYLYDNLGDIGPWSILVDAGWYISEGRPDGDWRNVDRAKFPSGLRALVEYAQARDIRVVLYFSTPALNDAETPRNWLGLRGIIDNHPDWLRPVAGPAGMRRFVYDYTNPEARDYLRSVLQDYLLVHGVDGVKLDGLGGGEEEFPTLVLRGTLPDGGPLAGQTREIYEHTREALAAAGVPDAYVESGWVTPVYAHSLAHTFRYADESPLWSHAYPFPGLKQHLEYALYQRAVLGQRGNLGATYSDPNEDSLGLSWLEAGLALGMQVTLSFDLPGMWPETLQAYRERLAALRPYQGTTIIGPGWPPEVFATTVEGTTYLGILHRGSASKEYTVPLAEYGAAGAEDAAVLDVRHRRLRAAGATLTVRVPPDSFRLFVIRRQPGVLWTGSSTVVSYVEGGMDVAVRGPSQTPGRLLLRAPRPHAVLLDGETLPADQWEYDAAAGALNVSYDHDGAHVVSVRW